MRVECYDSSRDEAHLLYCMYGSFVIQTRRGKKTLRLEKTEEKGLMALRGAWGFVFVCTGGIKGCGLLLGRGGGGTLRKGKEENEGAEDGREKQKMIGKGIERMSVWEKRIRLRRMLEGAEDDRKKE